MSIFYFPMDLQLFADGEAGADGGSVTGAAEKGAVAGRGEPKVLYGKQHAAGADQTGTADTGADQQPSRDFNAEFSKMIKGEFKEAYETQLRKNLDSRLRTYRGMEEIMNRQSPIMDQLAQRYGVDRNDLDGISKALSMDDAWMEQEAVEKGMSKEQLAYQKRLERESAELRAQIENQKRQAEADKRYAMMMQQAESLKQKYGSFDLETELQNPQFRQLMSVPGMDMETAFTVIHKDELIPAAMQYTADRVRESVAADIRAGQNRFEESATTSAPAVSVKADPSKYTHKDLAEIRARVARGEKITF